MLAWVNYGEDSAVQWFLIQGAREGPCSFAAAEWPADVTHTPWEKSPELRTAAFPKSLVNVFPYALTADLFQVCPCCLPRQDVQNERSWEGECLTWPVACNHGSAFPWSPYSHPFCKINNNASNIKKTQPLLSQTNPSAKSKSGRIWDFQFHLWNRCSGY